ncbi:ligand-binding sensor domain-containing protein [Spiroplasma chrysopicola]|uniref:Uncharacterized protein n=1 Tax=Spiroplasma chrysopicola DF-1 TaxID=1276227 RepID=R4U3I4_9MOLU|nr:hypothetical protein [Spiroplasma chrysopicola]AGM25063.1 hypothetical protein SCHRY_v1c04840 [Spiroplasma chrysopicola DF-1]
MQNKTVSPQLEKKTAALKPTALVNIPTAIDKNNILQIKQISWQLNAHYSKKINKLKSIIIILFLLIAFFLSGAGGILGWYFLNNSSIAEKPNNSFNPNIGTIKAHGANLASCVTSLVQLSNLNILVGTNNGDIFFLDDNGNINDKKTPFNSAITAMVQFSNNRLFGAVNKKNYELTWDGEIKKPLNNENNEEFSLNVTAITEISNNHILAGTEDGTIYELNYDGKITKKIIDHQLKSLVRSIIENNDYILVVTANGIIYKLNKNWEIVDILPYYLPFTSLITLASENNIMLGGTDKGSIYQINLKNNANIKVKQPNNETITGAILAIVQIKNGDIFIGSGIGDVFILNSK